MREQWLPLGPVGVISAFNFPNAVWAWNAMLAAVCGDSVVWKPSLLAPIIAIASNTLAQRVASRFGHEDLFTLVMGTDQVIGERFIADKRLPLISATGSCRMGRRVGEVVSKRLGRSLLELGGNNAAIVHEDADLDLAARAIVFAAVGTCGQRCTTTRRLIAHEKVVDQLLAKLTKAYQSVKIGDPAQEGTLVGPLANARAVEGFEHAIAAATQQGGTVLVGGGRAAVAGLSGHFVQPTIIRAPANNQLPIAREETFAPILYVHVSRHRGCDRDAELCRPGPVLLHLHPPRRHRRAIPQPRRLRQRLRHRQRQPRHQRRRDRRRVRRRERHRRRPRVRL
jgi:aldehyde dehydrogenase (NAD+)